MDRHKLIFLLLFCGRVFGQSAAPGPTSINSIKNAIYCLDTSVSANTITCSTALGFAGYSAGQTVDLKLANSVTGATTIAINGLASKAVTYNGTTTLVSGIFVAGGTYRLTYDGTRFVIQGSAGGSACGSIAACNTGAWTAGAFGYDFSGATSVGLPAPWVATNVSNTFSLQPQIFTNSGAVAGLRSAGGNTSDVNAGSFGVYGPMVGGFLRIAVVTVPTCHNNRCRPKAICDLHYIWINLSQLLRLWVLRYTLLS